MSDYDAAHVRTVLREHGHEIGDRGKISAANLELYYGYTGRPDPAGYGGGVTAADFPADDEHQGDELAGGGQQGPGPGPDVEDEQTPRGVGQASAIERARRLWARNRDRGKDQGGRGKARRRRRPAHEWVSTAPLIERIWGELAWSARPIPPLQRVLAVQAPMAGMVLQEAARDTIFDRGFLQPAARAEERLEMANAMLGPPIFTGLIVRFGRMELEPVTDPTTGQPVFRDGQPILRPVMGPDGPVWDDRTRVLVGGLRFSLISWIKLGQQRAEDIIAKADELDELGAQADKLIAYILSEARPQTHRQFQEEVRAQTEDLFGYRGPGAGQQAPAGDEPESSAMKPEPATPAAAVVPDRRPDPRTMAFMPPDPHIASQVVPRVGPVPQA